MTLSELLAGLQQSTVTLKTKMGELVAKVNSKAPLASPALTGTPSAPTAALGTNTNQIATTAFVQAALGDVEAALIAINGV